MLQKKKKAPAALGQALKNAVLMGIGMTAAQNDERGDQGLARFFYYTQNYTREITSR